MEFHRFSLSPGNFNCVNQDRFLPTSARLCDSSDTFNFIPDDVNLFRLALLGGNSEIKLIFITRAMIFLDSTRVLSFESYANILFYCLFSLFGSSLKLHSHSHSLSLSLVLFVGDIFSLIFQAISRDRKTRIFFFSTVHFPKMINCTNFRAGEIVSRQLFLRFSLLAKN